MSDPYSELVEISKLNGNIKKNYGRLIGAYLYLRSSASRGRSAAIQAQVEALEKKSQAEDARWDKERRRLPSRARANIVFNVMVAPAEVEKQRSAIKNDFGVKSVYPPAESNAAAWRRKRTSARL